MSRTVVIRIFGIYISIALISFGALVLGLFVLVAYLFDFIVSKLKLSKRTDSNFYLIVRRSISLGVRFYLRILSIFRLIKIVQNTLPDIADSQSKIFIANHGSLFDILFFLEKYPCCSCIVRPGLAYFSPYAILIHFARYLVNHRDSNIIEDSIKELGRGHQLIIFPEGTRLLADVQSRAGKSTAALQSFQRGAASISVRSGVPVIPVLFNYSPPALGRGFSLTDLPQETCEISVIAYAEKIPPAGREYGVLAREFNEELECFFKDVMGLGSINAEALLDN